MDWHKAATNISRDLPSSIMDIMNTLSTVWGESAFLGGGAVRDLLLGNSDKIRDWDFYLPKELINDREAILNLLKRLIPDTRIWVDMPIDPEVLMAYDDRWLVVKGFNKGTSFDFIFSGQQIKDFDHGICQCSLNCKTFKLETTEAFEWCVNNKTHRLIVSNLNSRNATRSLLEHPPRILKKYPWPVIADHGLRYYV